MKSQATYQKVICACCFLFIFANLGLPSSSFSVYQPYIAQMVGDSNASMVVASRTGTSLVCILLVGLWYKKLDCRLGVFLATMMTALGFLLYSQAHELALLCVAAAITGAGYGLGGMVGMTLLIGRWYTERTGTAIGIATMGSGLATLAVPLVATNIIHSLGLSASFAAEAATAALIGVIILALLRNQPAEAVSYSKDLRNDKPTDKVPPAKPLLTPRLRTAMLVGAFLVGAVSVVGQSYLSILLTTSGFNPYFAATMLTVNGACLMFGKGINGVVFDKLGRRRGSAIFFALLIFGIALCCLAWTGNAPLMVAGSAIMGVGVALATVGISAWSLDLSNPVERPTLVKNMQVSYAFGSFAFNLFPGALAELTGTYVTTYVICLAFAVTCAACILGVYRTLQRRAPEESEREAHE